MAAVVSFIDAINRGDVDRLGELMTEDHDLDVFDEPSLRGKLANIDAWCGYTSAFPAYVVYPHRMAERDGEVSRCSVIPPGRISDCRTKKKRDSS